MSHTPGPWKAKIPDSDEVWSEYSDVREGERRLLLGAAFISGAGWSHLALVYSHVQGQPDDEGIANAQLVCAAPDLLAACEMVLDDPGLTASANDVIRSAIAKARQSVPEPKETA